jgi:hypothetical protein
MQGDDVRKVAIATTLGLVISLALVAVAAADVIPTPWSKSFKGDVTYNGGARLPLGSIVDAYDDDAVHCGRFYVDNAIDSPGVYGFMPVYGDDSYSPLVDEGADPGDAIMFKINGRNATPSVVSGNILWQDKATATVNLSATDFTFGMTLVDPPSDLSGLPGSTLRFQVGVENTGNGIDYYLIEVTSANGWTVIVPSSFIYANSGQTAYVWFDVVLPAFSPDMYDELSYRVISQTALPTASVSGSVTATRDAGIVYDAAITRAPGNISAMAGELVHVEVGVTNMGNVPDMYSIGSSSDLAWPTDDPVAFWSADPTDTVYLSFDVQVPIDAPGNEVSVISFAVQSAASPTLTLESDFTITVTPSVYDAFIADAPANTFASPGELVHVEVGVTNDGNTADNYALSSSSDLAWATDDPASPAAAGPGATVYISFDVHVPFDAQGNQISTISFEIQSVGDPTLTLSGDFTISVIPTDADDDIMGALPTELTLAQNYPNPFNPTTTIGFGLPARSQVTIRVIDILGRTVDQLDLGSMSAGTHEVEYDASALSSGVYFYRIDTDLSSQTRKMVLVK